MTTRQPQPGERRTIGGVLCEWQGGAWCRVFAEMTVTEPAHIFVPRLPSSGPAVIDRLANQPPDEAA